MMTTQDQLQHGLEDKSLAKRALQGAGTAFVLAVGFLATIFSWGEALVGMNFWQRVWQFFPVITMTAGGALGGMVFHPMVDVWYTRGPKKVIAIVVCVLVYFLLLWFSSVAGFSATGQWD